MLEWHRADEEALRRRESDFIECRSGADADLGRLRLRVRWIVRRRVRAGAVQRRYRLRPQRVHLVHVAGRLRGVDAAGEPNLRDRTVVLFDAERRRREDGWILE